MKVRAEAVRAEAVRAEVVKVDAMKVQVERPRSEHGGGGRASLYLRVMGKGHALQPVRARHPPAYRSCLPCRLSRAYSSGVHLPFG